MAKTKKRSISETLKMVLATPVGTSDITDLSTALGAIDASKLDDAGRLELAGIESDLRKAIAAHPQDPIERAAEVKKIKNANALRVVAQAVAALIIFVVACQPGSGLTIALVLLVAALIARFVIKTSLSKQAKALLDKEQATTKAFSSTLGRSVAFTHGGAATGLHARADRLFLDTLSPNGLTAELSRRQSESQSWAQRRATGAQTHAQQQAQRAVALQDYVSEDLYEAAKNISDPDERRKALVDADMHTMDVLDDERRIAEGKTLDAAEVKRRSDEMHDARTQNILRNTDS